MLGSRAQHQTHLFQLQLLPSLRDKQDVLLTSNVHIVKKIFNVKCTYVYLVQFNSAPPERVYFISSKVQVCLVPFQLFWGQLYKVIQVYVSHGFIDSTFVLFDFIHWPLVLMRGGNPVRMMPSERGH
jgi:hypothetical protein